MFKELFKYSDLLSVPVFVMLFFFLVFTFVLIRVFSKKRKPHYDAMSLLPLDLPENRRPQEEVRS